MISQESAEQRCVFVCCRYRNTYKADLSAYKVPSKTGGGYWFEERQRAAAGNTVPFSSSTTYADEMLQGEQTEQQQKQCVAGLPDTLVGYQVARDHRYGKHMPSGLVHPYLVPFGIKTPSA